MMCMATLKRLIIKNGAYFVSTMVTSKPNLLHNTNWHHLPPQCFNVRAILDYYYTIKEESMSTIPITIS